MWIRSHDKEILVKAVCIYLCGENHICATSAEGGNWYIGKYSSEEKALKVLDAIDKLINRSFMYDYQHFGEVFQMPQDDEVEE